MSTIESYSFGRMIINGTTYSKDVLIYPDNSILSPWWRGSGHQLELSDIDKMLEFNPQIIVVGTGASGLMRPSVALQSTLLEKGIELIALPTAEAVKMYNEMIAIKQTGGCFHLTC